MGYFLLYKDTLNQWRWRLLSANHRIIAVSGEGYFNRTDAIAAINLVKGSYASPIRE